jgi:hypothetical protein
MTHFLQPQSPLADALDRPPRVRIYARNHVKQLQSLLGTFDTSISVITFRNDYRYRAIIGEVDCSNDRMARDIREPRSRS